MNKVREQLEGTTRQPRIRRIRRLALLLLFLLTLALSASALLNEGAGLKPLYFPLDYVLPLVLILLLVATFTNFVFRTIEIRSSRRDSQRFLIAKHSMHRALLVIVLCIVLGAVLVFPATGQIAENQLRVVRTGQVTAGTPVTFDFTSRDAFALSQAVDLVVSVRVGQPALRVEVFHLPDGRIVAFGDADGSRDFSYPIDGDVRTDYRVELRNFNPQPVGYSLTLDRVLMPELTTLVPTVLFAFAAANTMWFLYLRPLREKHKAASIYGVHTAREVDAGERTYSDYYRAVGPAARAPAAAGPGPGTMAAATGSEVAEHDVPSATDAPGLLEEGNELFENGRLEPALVRFDAALELEPDDVPVLLARAATLLRLQRRDEAAGSFQRVLEIEERNLQALAGLAEVHEANGRWGDAAATWGRYATVVPEEPDARLRIANALLKAKDRTGARRVLEEARRGFPDDGRIRVRFEEIHIDVPGLLSKALVSSASGRFDEAIALLDRILVQEPENVNALVSRGIALRRAGRADEALASLDAALQRQPSNTAALRTKGQVLEARGAWEDALKVYEALHEASPRDPEVWALQATVMEKLGENEAALAGYQQAIQLDPGNADYRAKAQELVMSRGTQERFIEELFRIKGMGPARVRSLLEAGFKTPEAIRKATEDDLAKVSGMTKVVAKDLFRHFQPEPPPP
jgi:tetratricopeptide (TPR) repeat protein